MMSGLSHREMILMKGKFLTELRGQSFLREQSRLRNPPLNVIQLM